jgi:DNA-binding transcriptional ArsR family regulator
MPLQEVVAGRLGDPSPATVNNLVDCSPIVLYDGVVSQSPRRQTALGAAFDALANEERRRILRRLARGAATTPEIASQFRFTKQAMSRHVAVLERAGLVGRSNRGRVRSLTLVPTQLDRISLWIAELRHGWHASLDRLDEVLKEQL